MSKTPFNKPWYDVKEYGAVGDGSTNDAPAINSAISAANTAGGGIVFFPFGTYNTSATLTARSSGVALLAISSNTTVIGTGALTLVNLDLTNVNTSVLSGGSDGQILKRTGGVWTPTDDYVAAVPTIDNSFLVGSISAPATWIERKYPARARRRNLLGMAFDPTIGTTGSGPPTGVIALSAIAVELPGTIANIVVSLTVVGGTLTAGQTLLGLYRLSGNTATIFAKTADQATAFAAGPVGSKTIAAPAVSGRSRDVVPGDIIYGAYMSNGTTPAAIGIQAGTVNTNMNNVGLTLPDFQGATFGTSLTNLPDTIDFTTVTTIGTTRWFGVTI